MGPVGINARERPHSGGGKDGTEGDTANTARRLAQSARSVWLRLRGRRHLPPDPGHAGLRRAARAALVMPAAFAFAQFVIGNAQVTTFVAFSCFALLVMADFGERRRPRALAYAAATGIGAVLIALGTLASGSSWGAALVMLLVGFAISFASAFGGYAAAAQTALLLCSILSHGPTRSDLCLRSRMARAVRYRSGLHRRSE